MTTEDKLKLFILTKYKNMTDFSKACDMPYSTLTTIFKRGLKKSSIHNVFKVCEVLGISADALANGEIIEVTKKNVEPVDVKRLLSYITKYNNLELDGKPLTKFEINLVDMALNMAVGMIRDNRK